MRTHNISLALFLSAASVSSFSSDGPLSEMIPYDDDPAPKNTAECREILESSDVRYVPEISGAERTRILDRCPALNSIDMRTPGLLNDRPIPPDRFSLFRVDIDNQELPELVILYEREFTRFTINRLIAVDPTSCSTQNLAEMGDEISIITAQGRTLLLQKSKCRTYGGSKGDKAIYCKSLFGIEKGRQPVQFQDEICTFIEKEWTMTNQHAK